jgi:predicted nucleic acid-binding protein
VKVVSDASPLITLARISCFDLLPKLFGKIYISGEVYKEVVIDGEGLPGAAEVSQADWVEVRLLERVAGASARPELGAGEVSSVALAKDLSADLVLIDEWRARRFAQEEGLAVIGCIGILENLYERGYVSDLRSVYEQLIRNKTRIDLRTLQNSLAKLGLRPL